MEVHMNLPYPGAVLPSADDTPSLPEYEGDFALWLRAQAELLHERKFELLDVENLAEEVDTMGKNLHRELKSRLNVILVHLLKVKFQPGHDSQNWLGTLDEQRDEIARLVEQSPSLTLHVAEYAAKEYPRAAAKASLETGLPVSTFPQSNPFSQSELLDSDYLPRA
jgi:hypothetical protein